MQPLLWILLDDEGLVVLSGGTQEADTEHMGSLIFMGYLPFRRALEQELSSELREMMISTSEHLILLQPLEGNLLVVVFSHDTPLGIARLGLKKLVTQVNRELRALTRERR